jgi:uncharacterized protein (DUF58 family)
MSLRVRPGRPLAPMAVTVVVVGTWWLVAHSSGAGWVQVLGDVVFGALLVGIVGPAIVLARARVGVVSAPLDTTAGLPVEVRIEASTRLRVGPREPSGIETFAGPARGRHRDEDRVTLLPARRGVHDSLTLDIASAAPFALQWWTRRVVLTLPSPLHVAPRCGRPVTLPWRAREHAGETSEGTPAEVGDPRGARPYRPGDNRRHVHWRATAHTGELMVREAEGAAAEPSKVVVALPADPEEAERVAEQALGTIVALQDRGTPVLLITTETSGRVEALVADRRAAGRRLARAVAPSGSPGSVRAGGATGVAVSL